MRDECLGSDREACPAFLSRQLLAPTNMTITNKHPVCILILIQINIVSRAAFIGNVEIQVDNSFTFSGKCFAICTIIPKHMVIVYFFTGKKIIYKDHAFQLSVQ